MKLDSPSEWLASAPISSFTYSSNQYMYYWDF
jgi:hypothetical protein